MAQFALEPPPMKKELERVAWLIADQMRRRGYRTRWEVADAMGLHPSDLSRLMKANLRRRWGYWRLERVARWLGVTLDEMLGRAAGTTRPAVREREPQVLAALQARMLVTRDEVLRIAEEIAKMQTDFRHTLTSALREEVEAEQLMSLIEEHVQRRLELERRLPEKFR
jgi:hypothetical protein